MLWICILLVIVRGTYSGYCTSSYKCYDTCYGRMMYEEKCGLWEWGRCTRYRAYSYSCTSTCYRRVCCLGYEGSYCQNPICSPPCSDGGRCIAPNQCSCRTGFSPPTCSDINECYRSHGCQHSCVNTYGSFYCTCRSGYTLKSDYKTCEDINECYSNKGGCQHSCTNTIGSFYCQCSSGYKLNYDGKSCSDVDECYAGTSGCAQTCHNRDGYFTCSCRAGYTLAINGKSCEDVDECSSRSARCQGYCSNTIGTYTCYCGSGYVIGSDGFSCQDIDECSNGNGNCDQKCINLPGTYSCECFRGYRMDGDVCKDIDECQEFTSGCSQLCNNTIGSFMCDCQRGYSLSEDKKTCKDVDDCEGVTCLHGGKCIDGLDKYTCSCESGYTDIHCQTDINECKIVNGGCYDVCINTDGGFYCNCSEGGHLQPDGFSCKSNANEGLTVFERNKLPRQLLPKGCFIIMLTKCTDGIDIDVYLSSTSEWYNLNSDTSVVFSLGIVFVKVNSLAVPISIRGLAVKLGGRKFEMHYGVQYSTADGTAIVNDLTPRNCRPFELGKGDIFDLIGADSFTKTMLLSIYPSLPDWLRFQSTKGEILAVQDLKSKLVYGEDIDDIAWCAGAPVHSNHLYTVFRFGSGFQLRVLEKDINMPKPLNSKKFCLIVDLCQSFGGTVFLMIPEESRELLTGFDVFRNLKEQQNLLILPRGIGVSLNNGIFINKQPLSFELWNGDKTFQPLIPKLDLWIGGDVVKNDPFFKVAGKADIYVGIPSVQTIFTSMFREEWTGLVDIAISASPELRFKIFGREHLITFKLITAVLNIYFSMGGSNRIFCGDVSNPPGLFVSALVDINPFKGVPILEDWIFYSEHRFYIFFHSEAFESSSEILDITVLDEVLEIDSLLEKIIMIIDGSAGEIESQLLKSSDDAIFVFRETAIALKKLKNADLYDIRSGNLNDKIVAFNKIRENFLQMEQIVSNFIDKVEFIANSAIQNLTDSINMFMDIMKMNIQSAMQKLTSTIANSVGSYKGFGFKYTTDLRIFKLVMGGMNIELVYSDGNLFRCSRFDKIRDFLKGERAIAFIASSYKEFSLGRFLSYRLGSGVGGAFAIDSYKVVVQLHAFISLIGIRTTGDIFITTNGLYFYVEGNVWDIFLAQINASAETGKEWYQLTFRLSGRLVANARKKRELSTKVSTSNSYIKAFINSKKIRRRSSQERQTYVNVIARRRREVQSVTNSFQSSYLDGLKKVISFIGEEANRRLTQVQNAFTLAQKGLSTAKIVLDDAKKSLTTANIHFDNAVVDLERVKQNIEIAKGPYIDAIRRLEEAKIYINNLCEIRVCPSVCIPGIKCNICYEHILGLRIPYPCCKLTSCMISFPDPMCVLANIACGIIRALAYVALEFEKLAVKVVLVAFDIAQAALTVTQFIVDHSRVVLKIAEGVLETAKFALDIANGVLFAAKFALEGVKFVIGVAVTVMELIIEYGLKSIVDVRNCGFEIELSTKDLPIFDVYCEVNVFRLGWTKINIGINFKNILQSIWQAARATINAFMKLYEGIVDGRKRRDLTFEASSKMHVLFRSIRDSGLKNVTEMNWNETINIAEDILGFSGSNVTATENMIQIFKEKCRTILKIQKFMHDAFSLMEDVLTVSKAYLDKISMVKQKLHELNDTGTVANVTIESMGISKEYAFADYNMTEDDINRAIKDTKTAAANNPLMAKIKSAANSSLESVDAERQSVESIDYLSVWFTAMNNITKDYFNKTECEDFKDCIFLSISTLYGLYEYENFENVSQLRDSIIDLEDILINTFQNESTTIISVADVMEHVLERINLMADTNVFCSEPPRFLSQPKNITVLMGSNVTFYCDADGDPQPSYNWFRNDEIVAGISASQLLLINVSETDNNTSFYCTAKNIVTFMTSDVACLSVFSAGYVDANECLINNGNCTHNCNNTVGSFECSCFPGYLLMTDGYNCQDINECLEKNGGCDQLCENLKGTFTCGCKEGFILAEDGISCADINECNVNNGGCLHKCKNEDGTFQCLCNDGFVFQNNRILCEDKNECADNNGGCAHKCVNEIGNFTCECQDGYTLEEDGFSCKDKDECYDNDGGCAHKCVNEEGSYKCICINGFQLQADGISCIDINECDNYKVCAHTCVNEVGSFKCECHEGFLLEDDSVSCIDINECDINNGSCAQKCVNTIGSFECYCRDGFNLQVDGVSCSDINECDINNGECEQKCFNEVGSFKCKCYDGFGISDDGLGCTDINECNDSNGNCTHTCVNTNGSFICQCDHGFTLQADGLSCIDINECEYNNGGCTHNCLNVEGSFKCQCNKGFEFQTRGLSCVDINGCDQREDSCTQKCVDELGTVKCHCDGFDPHYAGVSCVDINECDTHNDGCAHICLNDEGTYRCECTDGYTLNDDGHSCEDINECEVFTDVCGVVCLNFIGTYLCSCPAGFSLMDDDRTCRKLVEQTLKSILRLTVGEGITEASLKDIAEYKRIETNIIKSLTDYIFQYTNASFTILVHQISIGSIVVEYTVVINNGSSTTKTIGEIFESVMNLSNGDTMLFDGSIVQAKAEIPGDGSELCGIFELLHGSCKDGYRCEILDNKPTCCLVQSKSDQNSHSGSYVVYLAPSVGGVALIVMIILLTSCAWVIRKKRQNKMGG